MRIPANGKHLQRLRAGCIFPADVFLSSSFYSRSFALFAGRIRIRDKLTFMLFRSFTVNPIAENRIMLLRPSAIPQIPLKTEH